jgi:hypothetical protein
MIDITGSHSTWRAEYKMVQSCSLDALGISGVSTTCTHQTPASISIDSASSPEHWNAAYSCVDHGFIQVPRITSLCGATMQLNFYSSHEIPILPLSSVITLPRMVPQASLKIFHHISMHMSLIPFIITFMSSLPHNTDQTISSVLSTLTSAPPFAKGI